MDLPINGRISVRVYPDARKTGILKIVEGTVHLAVAAPPEDGKANAEVERFLAKETGKTAKVISGFSNRRKTVRIG